VFSALVLSIVVLENTGPSVGDSSLSGIFIGLSVGVCKLSTLYLGDSVFLDTLPIIFPVLGSER
jgi:hypothetical protein